MLSWLYIINCFIIVLSDPCHVQNTPFSKIRPDGENHVFRVKVCSLKVTLKKEGHLSSRYIYVIYVWKYRYEYPYESTRIFGFVIHANWSPVFKPSISHRLPHRPPEKHPMSTGLLAPCAFTTVHSNKENHSLASVEVRTLWSSVVPSGLGKAFIWCCFAAGDRQWCWKALTELGAKTFNSSNLILCFFLAQSPKIS